MMEIPTICPTCRHPFRIDSEFHGHDVRCGNCGNIFTATHAMREGDSDSVPADDREEPVAPRRRTVHAEVSARPPRAGSGVAALVIGIIAILTWWCPPLGLLAGGLAVILGCTSLQSATRSLAVVGIVLGIASVMFSLGCGVIYGIAVNHQQELDRISGGNAPPFLED